MVIMVYSPVFLCSSLYGIVLEYIPIKNTHTVYVPSMGILMVPFSLLILSDDSGYLSLYHLRECACGAVYLILVGGVWEVTVFFYEIVVPYSVQ